MDSKTGAIDYGEGCLMALLSSPVCDIRNWEDDVKKKTNRRQIWKANGDLVEHNSNLFTKNTGFVQADLVTFRTSGKLANQSVLSKSTEVAPILNVDKSTIRLEP